METTHPGRPAPVKLLLGLFFAALGILLTLDNLDLYDAGRVLRFWPVVLIVIGALYLPESGRRGVAVLFIAAGALLLAPRIWPIHFHVFALWPLILIVVGVAVVLRGLDAGGSRAPAQRTIFNVLTTLKTQMTPEELDGRRIVSFMGGAEIDLAPPGDDTTPVTVEVLSMWGGTVIRIPEGWEVHCDAMPVMGGVDVKAASTAGGRRLVVRGFVLMSGIEINNVRVS